MAETLVTLMLGACSLGWCCSIAKRIGSGKARGKSRVCVGPFCLGLLWGALPQLAKLHGPGVRSFLNNVFACNSVVCAFEGWRAVGLIRHQPPLAPGCPGAWPGGSMPRRTGA